VADSKANLAEALGTSHATNAVPFLIEMAGKPNGWFGSVWALGNIGDPRAIPPLIDMVKQKSRQTSGGFSEAVNALGALHAKDAVPVLLEHIELTDVIEALDEIGDATVIPALQKVVDSNGAVERAGVNDDAKTDQERLVAACIAVASLDPVDRTAKLCPLLSEPSFGEFQRRSVVWCLGRQPDPQAVPFLAKAIKTDASGAVVNQAITVLGVFKYKAAVDALIESFDADFRGKSDWKRAYDPGMFRDNIAESLSQLTGQRIGADKQAWLTWWNAHRDAIAGLK
jgi:HEAT repeat protein